MKKQCFIITPIGEKDSDIRKKAEAIINGILRPILEEYEYKVIVPHEISEPGLITNDVLEHIFEDELVVANLTGLNHNVVYELAARHAACKPVVTICEYGTKLPFDFNDSRTIFYTDDIGGSDELKKAFTKAVSSIDNSQLYNNPILNAVGFNNLIVNKNKKYEGDTLKNFLGCSKSGCSISIPYSYKTYEYGTVKCATMDEVYALSHLTKLFAGLNVDFDVIESDFKNCGDYRYDASICMGGPLANCEAHQYIYSKFPTFKCAITNKIHERHTNMQEIGYLPYFKDITTIEDNFTGFICNGKKFECKPRQTDYAILIKLTPDDFQLTNYHNNIHIIFGYLAESSMAAVKYFSENYANLYKKYENNHYFIILKVIPIAGCVDRSSNEGIIDLTEEMFSHH